MKRLLAPLSIVNQVAILMLLLGILGVAGMSISAWMSQSIQGNAHAINKAGSLRMQSYRLLAQVPLDARSESLTVHCGCRAIACWPRCRWMPAANP